MKKVMHGDKIKATIEKRGVKEQAEPEALIEVMLHTFYRKVRFNKDKCYKCWWIAQASNPAHWRTAGEIGGRRTARGRLGRRKFKKPSIA